MDSPNKLEQLLLDCLKKNADLPGLPAMASLSASDWASFLDLAKLMRVRSLLHHRLKEKQLFSAIPETAQKALKDAYQVNTLRNLRFYGELQRLAAKLAREDIPMIVLKGMSLAEGVYGNVGLREMNDIDLLVRPQHLSRISELLTTHGYKPTDSISVDMVQKNYLHIPKMVKTGEASVEVHWNLTSPGLHYSIDPAELWQRAYPVKLSGCNLSTLCPEDMLLHLCMHSAYQHEFAFGLRPSCDLAQLLDCYNNNIAWADVLDRAKRWGWQRGVYLALRLAKELLNANIPDNIIKDLQPTDLSEDIVRMARNQVFMDARFASTIRMPFAQFIEKTSLSDRFKIFLNRIFLTKRELALCYSLDFDSSAVYWYYPRRALDLLRRHGRTMRQVLDKEVGIIELAERKCTIDRYLSGKNYDHL